MRVFPLIFGLFWMAAAPAAVDLFQARVPLADQTEAARTAAVQSAFATVLVRITGDARIAESPDTRALLDQSAAFMQGSSYEQDGETLLLRASFDGPKLTAALQNAGLPFWSARRPSHLVWIGLDGDTPAILDGNEAETLAPLRAAAEARGVPLLFPRGDAADLDAVKPADIFVGVADGLLKASRRYNPDQILAVWLSERAPRWNANWSLLNAKGISQQWQSNGGSPGAALADGVQTLADFEARQFAVRGTPGAGADTTLEVSGIETLADYAQTLNYLSRMNRTRQVQVVAVEGARVLFRLRIEGSETELMRAIAAGGVLREAAATARGALGFSLVRG